MQRAGGPIRVLHVDDDPGFAETTATFIEREDERFEVETETGADDGLDRLADGEFDCVVSDYEMPGRDGIEFLQAVRDQRPEIPFVLFTGRGSEQVASEAISAGVTDYLQKEVGTDQYVVLANRIKNAVEGRRAQRERQRQLRAIETAQEGISILGEDGRYLYVNEAFADLHGYDPDEMVGEHWELAYPDEDVPRVHDEILPAVERVGYWHGETTSRRADGTTVEVDHTLATTDRGELVCTVRDISERKARERKIEQSTARLKALFENSPDMINVHDIDGTIVDPNPRLCEKTGYDADELTGMKVWDLDRTIDPEEARALWEDMAVGGSQRLEGAYHRRDGSTFPVAVHVRRLSLGGRDQFVVIARDVSDRKERERELKRYERIVEDLDDIATVIDPDGTITYVSPSVRRVLGYDPADLIGENGFSYQPERTVEVVADAIEYVVENPGESRTIQTEFRRADGSFCWVESTLRNRIEDDRIGGILVSSREVTERKTRQKRLQRQNERLNEFASVVSHDLRSPLGVARSNLELVREECDAERLDHVERAHERMAELIDELLQLARQGDQVRDPAPVEVATVVQDSWQTVATSDATISVETDATIRADRSRLAQLLENLLRNALDHGGADVTVTVGGLEDGFYVEDDGPGVPEADRESVFDAGYTTTDDGTGVGLNIVQQVAEDHDWAVRVTDGRDGGARFEVTGAEFAE